MCVCEKMAAVPEWLMLHFCQTPCIKAGSLDFAQVLMSLLECLVVYRGQTQKKQSAYIKCVAGLLECHITDGSCCAPDITLFFYVSGCVMSHK